MYGIERRFLATSCFIHIPLIVLTGASLGWAELFSNFSAAGTNECLNLSYRNCRRSGDRSLSYRMCSGSWALWVIDSTTFDGEAQLVGCLLRWKKLSVGVGCRHSVTLHNSSLMGLTIRPVWALDTKQVHSTAAVEWTETRVAAQSIVASALQLDPGDRLKIPTWDVSFLRSGSILKGLLLTLLLAPVVRAKLWLRTSSIINN